MRIEDLLAERQVLESQIEELKVQLRVSNDEVHMNAWRGLTPEEEAKEEKLARKELELKNLIILQIQKIANSDDNGLKLKYLESIPEEYSELKLKILSCIKMGDSRTEIVKKFINNAFLNQNDSEELGRDFDNSIALVGPDGLKIEPLNYMLRTYGAEKVKVKSGELSPIERRIFSLTASFSSWQISMGFFKSIFDLTELNENERRSLYVTFISQLEYYQALRKKYDADLIETSDIRVVWGYNDYYLVQLEFYDMLKTLPEDVKNRISDFSKQNMERVEAKKQPEQMDSNLLLSYLYGANPLIEERTPADAPVPISNENPALFEERYQELKARVAKEFEERRKSGYYSEAWQNLTSGVISTEEYLLFMMEEERKIAAGLEENNGLSH